MIENRIEVVYIRNFNMRNDNSEFFEVIGFAEMKR